ncbi:MAG: PfkB family carbohydrate kinase, partial [Clostridiales bacterium]|nr:PfkB family carbohydrate kinase [Clostridiales bacterium]
NAFLDCGIGNVIVKTGKSGCFFKSRKESFAMPAYDVPAVDTTGAGDNFASGFIAALLDGKDHMECCRYGHAVAGVSVQTVGANTGVRSREQVERFISAHGQGRG